MTETTSAQLVTESTTPSADRPRKTRRLALSPSRANDFKQCPLLYRFRTIDRLPEKPTQQQVRGTVVHAVLEQLFQHPAADRTTETAHTLLEPAWQELCVQRPELQQLFNDASDEEYATWLTTARALLSTYFELEDPRRLQPESCELLVETELPSGVVLRGYVDRIDVAPNGDVRIVDYKTGSAPKEAMEASALFQMKFYALVMWRLRGVVPRQLRLIYLANRQVLDFAPDVDQLVRFERTLSAIWQAILTAGRSGDFRPKTSWLCSFCDYKAFCPEFGGTPPPYPGWPQDDQPESAPVNDITG